MEVFIGIMAKLALQGALVYQQLQGNAENKNLTAVAALIPTAVALANTVQQAGNVFQQAQAENWRDDDERWKPLFVEVDAALAEAEARLV